MVAQPPARPTAIVRRDERSELRDRIRLGIEGWHAGQSPHTVRARLSDLRAFARWLELDDPDDPVDVALELVSDGPLEARALAARWLESMGQDELAPSTIARRLTTLRSLTGALQEVGLGWGLKIKQPKVDPYANASGPSPALVANTIGRLQRLASGASGIEQRTASRDLAIVLLLHDSGFRRSELAGCRWSDYQVETGRIRIRRKGGAVRRRTVSQRACEALERWRAVYHRDGSPPAPTAALFYALRGPSAGEPITPGGVYKITVRLGLGNPHGLRHTAATELQRKTGNAVLAQRFLGHKHLATTQVYLDEIGDEAGEATRIVAGEDGTA